jgi:hypothetical protein
MVGIAVHFGIFPVIFLLEIKKEKGQPAGPLPGRLAEQPSQRQPKPYAQASTQRRRERLGRQSSWRRRAGVGSAPVEFDAVLRSNRFSLRLLKYEDLLPACRLAKNCQQPSVPLCCLLFLFLLSVPVTVWIDSFDSWCSGVNPVGGRRWRWPCLCAAWFSCAPLSHQCTCVVLCLF